MNKYYNWIAILISVLISIVILIGCKQTKNNNPTSKDLISENSHSSKELDSFDIQIMKFQEEFKLPGVSLALIKNGQIHSSKQYGVLQVGNEPKINSETMFSVGSISKVLNAMIILRLVKDGKLNLDVDVNQYLKKWKLESNKYTEKNPVTLRAILSHTAGLSVSGFPDYLPHEPLPTIIQVLNGESPAKNEKVEVIYPVGSKFQYSGGGTTISQKVVEDVTGMPFQDAAIKYVFKPLMLNRSSFQNPLSETWKNVAKAHNENGEKVALPRGYESMPESAASGLWTTPTDIAKVLLAFYYSQEKDSTNFLNPKLFKDATTKVEPSKYGLGPGITSHRGDKLIQHGGSNDSYRAYFCFYFEKGYGYVVTTNGTNGMELIDNSMKMFEDYIREIK